MYQNIKKLLFHTLIPAVLSVLLLPMTAWAAEASCSVTVPVSIQVSGSNIPTGVPFKVVMERITTGAPMPEQSSMTIQDTGNLSFGPITYTAPGDYQYRIYQDSGSRSYFTFDLTIYTMTVRIGNDADGNLVAEVWAVSSTGEQKADEIVFENRYYRGSSGGGGGSSSRIISSDGLATIVDDATPLGSIIPDELIPLAMLPRTGDTTQAVLWMLLMAASGAGLLLLMAYRRRMDS